jgi:ribosomal protein S4
MHFIKKRRNKPLYKKILPLRKNIQNRDKFLKFKKQKWQKFQNSILRYKKKRFYDPISYFLPNFKNFFSKKFKYNLQNKQRLSLFYGRLKKIYLKKLVKSTLKTSKTAYTHVTSLFIEKLETRLDTALYRAYFSPTFNTARQLIAHQKIYVNDRIIQYNYYTLKKGDLITLDDSISNSITLNISKSKIWSIPPKHFYINYKTLQILVIEDIKYTNLSPNYSFLIDFNSFIKFYRK